MNTLVDSALGWGKTNIYIGGGLSYMARSAILEMSVISYMLK